MQERRVSEIRATGMTDIVDHSSSSASTNDVRLRGKDRSATYTTPTSASLSSARLVNRPFSCDVDSLSTSPIKSILQQQNHHPYFYNHQTTPRPTTAGAGNGSVVNAKRLNASYHQLSRLSDEEDTDGNARRHPTDQRRMKDETRQPPMAIQEDFVLEANEQNRDNETTIASLVMRQCGIQSNPGSCYVHLPSVPATDNHKNGTRQSQKEQGLDVLNGYNTMQRSASQCDFQRSAESDDVTTPIVASPHRRLQCQKSVASSHYHANARSDSNVHSTSVVDQSGRLLSNYHPPHSPFSIHKNEKLQQSTFFCPASTTASPSRTPRDYGGVSAIDRLAPTKSASTVSVASANLLVQSFQRTQANTSCSSVVSKHSAGSGHRLLHQQNYVLAVPAVAEERNSSENAPTKNSSDRKQNELVTRLHPQTEQQHHTPRASLRRGKAVDLSFYSAESQSRSLSVAGQQTSVTSSGQVKDKEKQSSSGRKGSSIFRKLIGGSGSSGKSTSADETAFSSMASTGPGLSNRSGSSAGLAADGPTFTSRTDLSSDSCDFKYEERVRRRIFAHYDCVSICADARPLLNGTSRLKDANLNAATGASQASKPYLFMSSNGSGPLKSPQVDTPISPSASKDDILVEDLGDGKNNDLVLSCPYFRNECGGEPIRRVSLYRNNYQQQQKLSPQYNGAVLEHLETWHRPATAAETSVLENLSNVYLGGRLCAKRQPQLVIEHVDQGAFYYRHCFSGKAHQNYFGIDESLGPVAVSVVREKLEVPDVRRIGLTSPYLYRLIIRLSDLTTFRGAILEESLPSYLSVKESREQQQSQQSPAGTPASGSGTSNAGGGVSGSTTTGGSSGSAATAGSTTGTTAGKIPVKELLELTIAELQIGCLRLALPVPRTEELLLKLDEQAVYTRYKVGILYCRAQQSTEEQMYNNENSSPAFDEFLDMLGQRVRLKGFDKYKGGLDSKGDTTGSYSLYTTYQQYEIMFHVSTLLPFTPQNKQQLSRKRHIGNDIVTVIFQEPGALPFSPQTMRSHFQHVFVVVRAHNPNTDNVQYSVSVSRSKLVPPFGPPIPAVATFPKSKDFRDFILTKIINAENAVHKSEKFAAMAARTRREFMRDLAENHVTSHTLEGSASGKIASILLGGSKRKDRAKPKLYFEAFCRGALVWDVQVLAQVEDFSLCQPVECFLGISADNLVLIERCNSEALFCTSTLSIIGWTSHGNSLKLYYDHADVIILRTLDDDDSSEMQEIIKRLQAVTKGCETNETILRRNSSGQLGFHIQHEGIVSDVEMYGPAWQAGLRQGSRLVEICKLSVATLSYDRVLDLLRTSSNVRVLVIPPLLEDGSPRRGCEDPYCSAVVGDDSPFVSAIIRVPTVVNNRNQQLASSRPRQSTVTGAGGRPAPPSYEATVSRRPISSSATGVVNLGVIQNLVPFTQSMTADQSPELRSIGTTDYGYESGSGGNHMSSTKSLEELQNRLDRRHSEDIRRTSTDNRNANESTTDNAYYGTTMKPPEHAILEEHWHQQQHMASATGGLNGTTMMANPRTDTLSSSGSTASSEISSDSVDATHGHLGMSRYRPTRPSELKRRVDKANSDIVQRAVLPAPILERTSTDPCSSITTMNGNTSIDATSLAPPLPPRNYRNKYNSTTIPSSSSGLGSISASSLSSSAGYLSVPGGGGNQTVSFSKQGLHSSSVQENLLRLIGSLEAAGELDEAIVVSSALHRTLSDTTTPTTTSANDASPTQPERKYSQQKDTDKAKLLNPETERGIEWASLVDAATRAIEGITRRASSNNGSPEFSSHQLRLQAALQRIELLEEKVERLQLDLDKERESKHNLEAEVLHLREVNQRLSDECKNAKSELKQFTEWFFNAVENSSGQQEGPPISTLPDSSSTPASGNNKAK